MTEPIEPLLLAARAATVLCAVGWLGVWFRRADLVPTRWLTALAQAGAGDEGDVGLGSVARACEHPAVDLEHLHRELAGHGWRLAGDTLSSATGEWWLSTAHLRDMPPLRLYGAIARRYEQTAHVELAALLRGLAACSAEVRTVVALHTAARAVFVSWCTDRGCRLREWYLGWPSLRASARHPNGGIACIEWLANWPVHTELFAFHWIDFVDGRRRSWHRLVCEDVSMGDLAARLDDAVLALSDSPLAAKDGHLNEDDLELPLLR